jgi:hypothetical protein
MAHYAYVVDNMVQRVHVLANPVITNDEGVEVPELGQTFLSELHGLPAENFIQCSYNGTIRGVYPGAGFTYDPVADVFVAPVVISPEVPDEVV